MTMVNATGLKVLMDAVRSVGTLRQLAAGMVIIFLGIVARVCTRTHSKDTPPSVPGFTFSHILPFFYRRLEFLTLARSLAGASVFQFNLLQKTIVVATGETARHAFFASKGLDLPAGTQILVGGIPTVYGGSDSYQKRVSIIYKRISELQRNDSLSNLIPSFLEDIKKTMESWGNAGRFDPFDDVYAMFFQLSIRALSCTEIADDPELVRRLNKLYVVIEETITPATILLPWFPSPAQIKKIWATKKIYDILSKVVDERLQSGVSRKDTLQMLFDKGDERLTCIAFMMGLLVAALKASGLAACWLVILLGGYPEWREKARIEVEDLIATYAKPGSLQDSLSSALSSIPLDVLENKTPVLDAIIREELRMAQVHTAMRQNLGPEMYIDGKRIRHGDYVIYPFSDIHLDPEIYDDPHKFDPGRPEERKSAYGFIGWGGGRTLCAGARMAKVELKLTAAMLLLGFEHRLVDGQGNIPKAVPGVDWNDTLNSKLPKGICVVEYARTSVPL